MFLLFTKKKPKNGANLSQKMAFDINNDSAVPVVLKVPYRLMSLEGSMLGAARQASESTIAMQDLRFLFCVSIFKFNYLFSSIIAKYWRLCIVTAAGICEFCICMYSLAARRMQFEPRWLLHACKVPKFSKFCMCLAAPWF